MRNGHVAQLLTLGILLALAGCNKTGTSSDSTSSVAGAGATQAAPNGVSLPPPSPNAATAPVVIHEGTRLTVTLDQNISTKTNSSGDKFEASLAEPVTVDGSEVLPRGTKVHGTVTQSDSAGHIKGGAVLELTLDSITFHGQRYAIETSSYRQQGKSRGKRTAVGAGGGAALGAIVGAIAGGGKGAAIGAAAGGGAGTAGAAYTGDRDLGVPAEALLHFKLSKSVSITQ
jgi:hypothetical protein